MTTKKRTAQPTGLTPQDAHNLIQLLNRVQVQGTQEATVLAVLAGKLDVIKSQDPTVGQPDGKDSP